MSEETTASQSVSDEDLDRAAIGDLDEEVLETSETKKTTDEVVEKEVEEGKDPVTHEEKTWLGRKIKEHVEKVNTEQDRKFEALLDRIDKLLTAQKEPAIDDDDDNDVLTKAEARQLYEKLIDERENQKTQAQTEYESKYVKTVFALGDEDSDLHKKVLAEMDKPGSKFNVRHSDDPERDAERNYRAAQVAILKGRIASKKIPLREEDAEATGVSGDSLNTVREKKLPPLDSHAQEFIKSTGMSEDDVKAALAGPAPSYLGGR